MTIALLQRLEQRLQRFVDGVVVENAQLFAGLPLPLGQLGKLLVEQGFQVGNIFVELVALAVRQLGELGFVHRLAFAHRCKGERTLLAEQADLLAQASLLNVLDGLVVVVVELALNQALFLLVAGCRRPRERCPSAHQQRY